jgi:translation initiation factor IF-2
MVLSGTLTRNGRVRLLREGTQVWEGKLSSLKRFKDDVREVAAGYECGIGLEERDDIREKDIIEGYVLEEVARKLA